jgi:hypothetical protein
MQIPDLVIWNELTVSARYVVVHSLPDSHTPTGKLKKVFASACFPEWKDWRDVPLVVRQSIALNRPYVIPERFSPDKWAEYTTAPFITEAWDYFSHQSEDEKAWARGVTQEWLDGACNCSRDMYLKRLVLPVETLALRAYSYSYYRATATYGHGRPLDETAHRLWVDSGWIEDI